MNDELPSSDEGVAREPQQPRRSIRDLPPLETGGSEARRGFDLQDHVAARHCIQMLTDSFLKEVWCETQDDITLIWQDGATERVEFIQVKNNQLDGLWSVAKLCSRDAAGKQPNDSSLKAKRIGTSILERSLAYDRCQEACCFRVVTSWQVDKQLKFLTFSAAYRSAAQAELTTLIVALQGYVGDFRSPNGRDCAFWAGCATWEVVGSTEAVKAGNLLAFEKYLGAQGTFVAVDQAEELYMRLVAKVAAASRADWRVSPSEKRIQKGQLAAWIQQIVKDAIHPSSHGGRKLRTKMKNAMLPGDSIESAAEERAWYREELLTQRYFTTDEYRAIEGEVLSRLHTLRTQLDSGALDETGIAFHARCRADIESFRQSLPADKR
jgi:Cap4-like dsDNA endonuclease family protein